MTRAGALGIIFPNMHEHTLPELSVHRTLASVPFAGRYRMIDFCLSGMARAGIQNIGVIVRQNYQSLMDHLGNGREWDLSSKRGGLVIFPPYGREGGQVYHGRLEALNTVMEYLSFRKEELVVMSDCDIACNIDFTDLIAKHRASGADVTAVYEQAPIPEALQKNNAVYRVGEDGLLDEIRFNEYKKGNHKLAMNVYVIGRELLMGIVRDSIVRGLQRFEKEYLSRNLKKLKVQGYEFKDYRARIYDMRSYFEESLRLVDKKNLSRLFPEGKSVYTKVRDEAPVRYAIGSSVKDSLVADGCIIEGDVEGCVLFRGVRVGPGARLRNCVIMQGSTIEADVQMENVVADKNVQVAQGQMLRGAKNFPVFVAKGSHVL